MKTLVIGSTCIDIVLKFDHLPKLMEDINTKDVTLNMGGMAYNVYQILEITGSQAILATPVGTGQFANIMLDMYKQRKVEPFHVIDNIDNGFCLCLVDKSGERTFISNHGAEYMFDKSWYKDIDFSQIDNIYVGGLEVEEETGIGIVEMLEEVKRPVLFAPGPRLLKISKEKMDRIIALHPILHINELEASQLTGLEDYKQAASALYQKTNAPVIITLSDKGCYLKDGKKEVTIPSRKVEVVDTIGAGDSHAGAILSGLQKGLPLEKCIESANLIASEVVTTLGSGLKEDSYQKIKNQLFK